MPKVTPHERAKCVLAAEVPDRVPHLETGIDFAFVCRLLNPNMPAGKVFEAGEIGRDPGRGWPGWLVDRARWT
jgi:hypothetical protein